MDTVGTVFYVDACHVDALWQSLEPLVSAALRGTPTHDAADVRYALHDGKANLFVQFKKQIEAIAITEFSDYPKGRWLNFWLVAAQPSRRLDIAAWQPVMRQFAKNNQCRGYQILAGRKGWVRKMRPDRVEGVSARWTFA